MCQVDKRWQRAARREAEAVHQEGMQQPAGRANERRLRGEQEARVLVDMRWWCKERACMDDMRLAGDGQR
jgi:hypothetical protein